MTTTTRKVRPRTARQTQIVTTIHKFIGQNGFPPTLGEIAELLDMTTSTAQGHVDRLIRKGVLSRGDGEARRTLTIIDEEFIAEKGQPGLAGRTQDELVTELKRRGFRVSVRKK